MNPIYKINRRGRHNPSFRHGMSIKNAVHPLYSMWKTIKERCYSLPITHKSYKYYRGKGITMNENWATNFVAFFNWATTNGWQKGLTIDRINPDGNYEPDNCRFLTMSENSKQMAVRYNYKGEKSPLSKLKASQVLEIREKLKAGISGFKIAKEYGMNRSTIYDIRDRKIWKSI